MNVVLESWAMHLRNLIEFLHSERPQDTDVIAADFFSDPAEWERIRTAAESRGLLPSRTCEKACDNSA